MRVAAVLLLLMGASRCAVYVHDPPSSERVHAMNAVADGEARKNSQVSPVGARTYIGAGGRRLTSPLKVSQINDWSYAEISLPGGFAWVIGYSVRGRYGSCCYSQYSSTVAIAYMSNASEWVVLDHPSGRWSGTSYGNVLTTTDFGFCVPAKKIRFYPTSALRVSVRIEDSFCCSDGMLQGPEACDDGNHLNQDGCSSNCTIESGYSCSSDSSTPSVCNAICGDGLRLGYELCDDNNNLSGDGCSSNCTVEPYYKCSDTQPSNCTFIGEPTITSVFSVPSDGGLVTVHGSGFHSGIKFGMVTRRPDSVSFIPHGVGGIGKYNTACEGGNGFIYALPSFAPSILKINPHNDSVETLTDDFGGAGYKWVSCVRIDNGDVIGIPLISSSILRIFVSNDTALTFGDLGQGGYKWWGAVFASNKFVYGVPDAATSILKVSSVNSFSTFGVLAGSGDEPQAEDTVSWWKWAWRNSLVGQLSKCWSTSKIVFNNTIDFSDSCRS